MTSSEFNTYRLSIRSNSICKHSFQYVLASTQHTTRGTYFGSHVPPLRKAFTISTKSKPASESQTNPQKAANSQSEVLFGHFSNAEKKLSLGPGNKSWKNNSSIFGTSKASSAFRRADLSCEKFFVVVRGGLSQLLLLLWFQVLQFSARKMI